MESERHDPAYGRIVIRDLPSGYRHARGTGPCEWAQWPVGAVPSDEDFFPEASDAFRAALLRQLEPTDAA